MIKYFKILLLLNLTFFFFSCGSVKEAFTNQKKNSSDEFLVEKKSPLVMPPDYNELPIPKNNENKTDQLKIKSLIINNPKNTNISENNNKNFEKIILEKIKKN